ncbi:GntR family transcriptional regulator [Bifidobacterium sp. B4001]|uniref:GntR family transcriptional regulator n=1 Tax=unclassified Bifidobacterium TaxID=2608897 RepID=UPI00226B403D|nr:MULTISPECIES: GntR family transcriptional regulator [unclassified Bifidobacterium]MCX8672444.1 GntR family transcriptional regulator [Bifidobacterium sp. B4079]MCX8680877.1 GntR family transcriptional regulator [Bifidobacterium sp. B4001]
MKLIISSLSGQPIYRQIEDQIRSAILTGDLRAGEGLPSLRRLSQELRVSVLTVTRAYTELAQEGLVENIQGKGTFVADSGDQVMRQHLENRVQSLLGEAVDTARRAGMKPDQIRGLLDGLLGNRGPGPASGEGKE